MERMRLTRNRQNTRFGGKSYAAACAGRVRRHISSQVICNSVSRSETCRSVLFEIEIPCILLFLNRSNNSHNSLKRMHPKISSIYLLLASSAVSSLARSISSVASSRDFSCRYVASCDSTAVKREFNSSACSVATRSFS